MNQTAALIELTTILSLCLNALGLINCVVLCAALLDGHRSRRYLIGWFAALCGYFSQGLLPLWPQAIAAHYLTPLLLLALPSLYLYLLAKHHHGKPEATMQALPQQGLAAMPMLLLWLLTLLLPGLFALFYLALLLHLLGYVSLCYRLLQRRTWPQPQRRWLLLFSAGSGQIYLLWLLQLGWPLLQLPNNRWLPVVLPLLVLLLLLGCCAVALFQQSQLRRFESPHSESPHTAPQHRDPLSPKPRHGDRPSATTPTNNSHPLLSDEELNFLQDLNQR
ncbi:hypothetical protein [uncultured Ferrimonas sp.]|uniref:hypothetical protein n=1 Tax=uncultured Ferrimonas sp. TaxID=432640 RepID=UPI00263016C3|nr:hypothetical protein [uncultured Ferrimonas sp.]